MEEKTTFRYVAGEEIDEVLSFVRTVMRGEIPEREARARIRAAVLLGRFYGLWDGRGSLEEVEELA